MFEVLMTKYFPVPHCTSVLVGSWVRTVVMETVAVL